MILLGKERNLKKSSLKNHRQPLVILVNLWAPIKPAALLVHKI